MSNNQEQREQPSDLTYEQARQLLVDRGRDYRPRTATTYLYDIKEGKWDSVSQAKEKMDWIEGELLKAGLLDGAAVRDLLSRLYVAGEAKKGYLSPDSDDTDEKIYDLSTQSAIADLEKSSRTKDAKDIERIRQDMASTTPTGRQRAGEIAREFKVEDNSKPDQSTDNGSAQNSNSPKNDN